MDVITVGTGVSIQAVALVVGGTIAFGVGALKWIDTRIGKAAADLGQKILTLDERYREDRLHLESRIVRLESRGQTQAQWPHEFHSASGQ